MHFIVNIEIVQLLFTFYVVKPSFLLYLILLALCTACDLNTDLEHAHPVIETRSFPPSLIRFFCNYAALKGEMDAFNHLSYQLCAKQQSH